MSKIPQQKFFVRGFCAEVITKTFPCRDKTDANALFIRNKLIFGNVYLSSQILGKRF